MPNSSAYHCFAAARSAAQKLTVVSPRNIGAPFAAANTCRRVLSFVAPQFTEGARQRIARANVMTEIVDCEQVSGLIIKATVPSTRASEYCLSIDAIVDGNAAGRRGVGLTKPNASLDWGHAHYHPTTDASGVGSMPELHLWRKRTHWRPFDHRTTVHIPCRWQDLCGDYGHAAVRAQASALVGAGRAGLARHWVSRAGGGLRLWRGRAHCGRLAAQGWPACAPDPGTDRLSGPGRCRPSPGR